MANQSNHARESAPAQEVVYQNRPQSVSSKSTLKKYEKPALTEYPLNLEFNPATTSMGV